LLLTQAGIDKPLLHLFLKLGIQVAVVNQRAHARELPYTFIFRYALAGYLVVLDGWQ
jgi:hypothetical protein